MLYVLVCCRIYQSENNFPLLRMLANLLLPLLLVACGSQAQDYWFCTFFGACCSIKLQNLKCASKHQLVSINIHVHQEQLCRSFFNSRCFFASGDILLHPGASVSIWLHLPASCSIRQHPAVSWGILLNPTESYCI